VLIVVLRRTAPSIPRFNGFSTKHHTCLAVSDQRSRYGSACRARVRDRFATGLPKADMVQLTQQQTRADEMRLEVRVQARCRFVNVGSLRP